MNIIKKLALAVFVAALVGVVQAAPVKAYSNENMIDNAVFDAKDAMNEAQIRAFIQSRPNTCLTRVGSGLGGGNIFDEPMDYFTYGPNKVDAARVIYKAAQYNEINPRVILATLQKEQGLITDNDCVSDIPSLNKAMGYACYEGADACPASWAAGFERQVMKGAWQLAFDRQRAEGNTSWGGNDSITYGGRMTEGNRKRCGSCTVIYYDGYSVIDGVNTRMGNGATASLYNYTPHRNQSFPYWFEFFFGAGSTSSQPYSWSIVSQSYGGGDAVVASTDKETLTLVARNTGSATWTNSGANPVRLGSAGPNDRASNFYDPSSWVTGGRPAQLREASVAPGQNGTFVFTVQIPAAGVYQERFNLLAENLTWFNDPGMYYYFNVVPPSFSSEAVSNNLPGTIATGATTSVTVTYKNTSNVAWHRAGFAKLKLGTYSGPSQFADTTWESSSRAAYANEAVVGIGQNATFTFNIKAPSQPGTYTASFQPVIEGWAWVWPETTKSILVTGSYSATSAGAIRDITLMAGEAASQTVSYTNTGTSTWKNNEFPILKLGLAGPYGRSSSSLYDSSWASQNRLSVMNQTSVATSQQATFDFTLRAPAVPGVYTETFAPVAEGLTWINSPLTYRITVVKPTYSWQLVSQAYSNGSVNASPGQPVTLTVVAKNTGNVTWYKNQGFPVKLATTSPNDRLSRFRSSNWPASTRAALLTEESVAPGQNGTFSFEISVPPVSGAFFERFNLVAEGYTWLNDPGMYFYLNVTNNYSWQLVSQAYSNGSVNVSPGQTTTLTVVAKNTGNTTWYKNGGFPVRLGTTSPRNRQSTFYSPSWLATSRPAAITEDVVAPGQNGTFTFNVVVPAGSGVRQEYYSLLAEGYTWLNDPGMYFYFNVQ